MRELHENYPMTYREPQSAMARPKLFAPGLAVWSFVAAVGTYPELVERLPVEFDPEPGRIRE